MRTRAVLQITPASWTVHADPLATTSEIEDLRTAAAAFMGDLADGRRPAFRTGFYWASEDGGVFLPGPRLSFEEALELAEEVGAR